MEEEGSSARVTTVVLLGPQPSPSLLHSAQRLLDFSCAVRSWREADGALLIPVPGRVDSVQELVSSVEHHSPMKKDKRK